MLVALASLVVAQPALTGALLVNESDVDIPLEEFSSKMSYYKSAPNTVTGRNAHVLRMTLRMGVGIGSGTVDVGIPTSSPGELGNASAQLGTWNLPVLGNTEMLWVRFTAQTDVYIHLANASHDPEGVLASGTVPIYTRYTDTQQQTVIMGYPYDFEKRLATEDVGIDTRRHYTTANKVPPSMTGEPPSSNAGISYLNFGSWKYHGGLFAGTIQTPDRSGLGRIQLKVDELTTTELAYVKYACMSLYQMPVLEPGGEGTLALGAFWLFHGENDPPSVESETLQNWGNRIDVDPDGLWDGNVPGNPPNYLAIDFSHKAVSQVNFPAFEATGSEPDYRCWQLTRSLIPTDFANYHDMTRLVIAHLNEPTAPTGYMWRSFASKEFNAEGLPYPHNDVAPRLWVVKVNEP